MARELKRRRETAAEGEKRDEKTATPSSGRRGRTPRKVS